MTSEHLRGHRHGRRHGRHNEHHQSHEPDLAETLDLDALLLHEHLQEIFAWTATHQPAPRSIVDLGAGTGTGTLGLTRTFPQASVVAVDSSEFMLAHLATVVAEHQLSDRVSTLLADLDATWPKLADVDLMWAASSMHHMSDPAHILSQIGRTLAPEGLLVVVEMDTLPRHLPDDLGFGAPGLEQRLHDAAALAGWNAHPDWAPAILEAGMEVAEQRTFTYDTDENRELIAHNAQTFLSRMRTSLEGALSAEDRATIDQLLDPHGAQSLTGRSDLSMRGSRTVWAARPRR